MTGLARVAKYYGGIVINGQRFVWDYKRGKPVPVPKKKVKKAKR
jgi:hypothetical protein